jgi:hypothetical protein
LHCLQKKIKIVQVAATSSADAWCVDCFVPFEHDFNHVTTINNRPLAPHPPTPGILEMFFTQVSEGMRALGASFYLLTIAIGTYLASALNIIVAAAFPSEPSCTAPWTRCLTAALLTRY